MPGETPSPDQHETDLNPEDYNIEGIKPEPPQQKESTDKLGAQFLHQKDSRLHTSPSIENTQERLKAKGEETSQKPADKIEAYLDRFKEALNPEPLNDSRDFDRKERNVDFLKNRLYENVVIKPDDIPEGYYDNQRRLLREQGHGDIEITDEMRAQLSEVIISDQKSTLDTWTDYLTSPDSDSFPTWSKYWAYTGMLRLSTYDKEKHSFGTIDKGTVAPFPDLNREALAYVVDSIVKKVSKESIPDTQDNPELQRLLQVANFGKLYGYAIEKVTPTEESELVNTQGEWVKYDQGSDHMPLVNSLQGHGTGWCTAGETTAQASLQSGDFHVFYSFDQQGKPTIPRVAIRMEDSDITEVRGVAYEQNLDPYIGDVVDKKLSEFPDGRDYQKKVVDMKQLTEIEEKHKSGEQLTKENIRFLYEFDSKIEGFGYDKDPRIEEILYGRDRKSDMSHMTGYTREQISIGTEVENRVGIKFHLGMLDYNMIASAERLTAEGRELPEMVYGDVYLENLTSAKGVKFPKTVNGDLILYGITSAEGLELPKTLGGLDLSLLTSAEGLKLPETGDYQIRFNRLPPAEKQEVIAKYPKLRIL